jgi:hypothetical protein
VRPTSRRVLDHLAACSGNATLKDVADALGLPVDSRLLRYARAELVDDGFVVVDGRGSSSQLSLLDSPRHVPPTGTRPEHDRNKPEQTGTGIGTTGTSSRGTSTKPSTETNSSSSCCESWNEKLGTLLDSVSSFFSVLTDVVRAHTSTARASDRNTTGTTGTEQPEQGPEQPERVPVGVHRDVTPENSSPSAPVAASDLDAALDERTRELEAAVDAGDREKPRSLSGWRHKTREALAKDATEVAEVLARRAKRLAKDEALKQRLKLVAAQEAQAKAVADERRREDAERAEANRYLALFDEDEREALEAEVAANPRVKAATKVARASVATGVRLALVMARLPELRARFAGRVEVPA